MKAYRLILFSNYYNRLIFDGSLCVTNTTLIYKRLI